MLTIQEAFNKAYLGVMQQGRASVNISGRSCLYRGPDGAKCAVGFLIADEHYDRDLEGCPVDLEPVGEALRKSGVETDVRFCLNTRLVLGRLQGCHDNLGHIEAEHGLLGAEEFRRRFKEGATHIAIDYNLTVPEFTPA